MKKLFIYYFTIKYSELLTLHCFYFGYVQCFIRKFIDFQITVLKL